VYGRVAGICLATTLFICSVAGFPMAPSALPASSGALTLTHGGGPGGTFAPGASIEVQGSGFAPEAPVTVAMYSEPESLAETAADPQGHLDVTVKLPATLKAGRHTLVALGASANGTGIALTAPITVATAAAVSAVSSPAQLAWTGFNLVSYLIAGLVLVVAGLVLVRTVGMRRRLVPASGSAPAEPGRHAEAPVGAVGGTADVD
jgi:hypothetical protein